MFKKIIYGNQSGFERLPLPSRDRCVTSPWHNVLKRYLLYNALKLFVTPSHTLSRLTYNVFRILKRLCRLKS
jgi:hypothetical protein